MIMTGNTKKIKKSQDLDEFAGKIVCYSVIGCNRLLFSETNWPKPEGYEGENFGYIPRETTDWRSGETSYNMSILKGKDDVVCECALTDDIIHEAGLTMREATPEEIEVIRKVCESKEGHFDYRDWPKLNDGYSSC